MNLIIPLASQSKFFDLETYKYPKPLVEIIGQTIIQRVVSNLTNNYNFEKIIYIVNESDCINFNLHSTLNLLTELKPVIIKVFKETKGALCSTLLAIDDINDDQPLVIANADQIFINGIDKSLKYFLTGDFDAACLTFESVHPRWSYVRLNDQGLICEAVEKMPISKNAIAGLYMYKSGSEFIKYSKKCIKRGVTHNELYYISPVFNEYILDGKKVGNIKIENSDFFTLYAPEKIEEYELYLKNFKI